MRNASTVVPHGAATDDRTNETAVKHTKMRNASTVVSHGAATNDRKYEAAVKNTKIRNASTVVPHAKLKKPQKLKNANSTINRQMRTQLQPSRKIENEHSTFNRKLEYKFNHQRPNPDNTAGLHPKMVTSPPHPPSGLVVDAVWEFLFCCRLL